MKGDVYSLSEIRFHREQQVESYWSSGLAPHSLLSQRIFLLWFPWELSWLGRCDFCYANNGEV